jgi:hypothetical protein
MASRPARNKIGMAMPELRSLSLDSNNWQRTISGAISLALLATIIWKMRDFGFANALATLPANPFFWIAFAAYYLALPFSEWLIFKRLWSLPSGGFVALLRKLVSNEVLFGYSGEVQFYAWARGHAEILASPYGAIKDVSVLSAVAGNLITLTMLGLAWPMVGTIVPQFHGQAVFASASAIILMSMVIFIFRNRIFSLASSQLRAIFAVHIARLLVTTLLSGVMWHVALPQVPLIWLVLLATVQLLVTRLPFVPNKDMVFASLAIFLVGHDAEVGALITMIAAAILAVHLMLGGLLNIAAFIETPKS